MLNDVHIVALVAAALPDQPSIEVRVQTAVQIVVESIIQSRRIAELFEEKDPAYAKEIKAMQSGLLVPSGVSISGPPRSVKG